MCCLNFFFHCLNPSNFFRNMPGHTSREVLIIFGGLSTCDPGDINETVKVSKTFTMCSLPVNCSERC